MPRHKSTTSRRRKFIRKDSHREYASRSGMIEVGSTDGTSTYFTPGDLFYATPDPPMRPCVFCKKKTARTKLINNAETPVCVMCGIEKRGAK